MTVIGLPSYLPPLLGRQADLAAIRSLLSSPECRLLTLCGLGGIGKTRLAAEVARSILPEFTERAVFVPLQPLVAADQIGIAIAEALGLRLQPDCEPEPQLLDYFHERSVGLILDNFEHLLSGADLLIRILSASVGVRILVTSRERINLLDEWVFEVPALAVPLDFTAADFDEFAAVQLFLHHARRIDPSFALTAEDRQAIGRICQSVGGMPLALEMAAGWTRVMTVQEIAGSISAGLDLQHSPVRNVEPRHRSIRAVFEPTWAMLSEAQQDVFRRLSVFRGGFTRASAEAVSGATLHDLADLVDKSLIQSHARGRFDLHELLRQFAVEKLKENPQEERQLQQAHAAWFAEYLDLQWSRLTGGWQKEASRELIEDAENIRLAWWYHVQSRDAIALRKSLKSFFFLYDFQGWYAQGYELLSNALGMLKEMPPTHDVQVATAMVMAAIAPWLGDPEEGHRVSRESVALLQRLNEPAELPLAMTVLSTTSNWVGTILDYSSLYEEWLVSVRQTGRPRDEAVALLGLGWIYRNSDNRRGKQLILDAAQIAARIGDYLLLHVCLHCAGVVSIELEERDHAAELFHRAIDAAQEINARVDVQMPYYFLGILAHDRQEYREAVRLFRSALEIAYETGDHGQVASGIYRFGRIEAVAGDKVRAVELIALSSQFSLPAILQRECQYYLAELQSALPYDVFEAACERGAKLRLNDVARLLLAEVSDEPPPPSLVRPPVLIQPLVDPLSERELEVLLLIAEGMSNGEIAARLFVAMSTVKKHINHIFAKLGVSTRGELLAHARQLGLI